MRDIFCSYYTNSKDITEYMVSKLGVVDNDIILEPSAGEGIFIDEVLETSKTVQIDALDINSDAISILKKKYEDNTAVVVRETDTLLDEQICSVPWEGITQKLLAIRHTEHGKITRREMSSRKSLPDIM